MKTHTFYFGSHISLAIAIEVLVFFLSVPLDVQGLGILLSPMSITGAVKPCPYYTRATRPLLSYSRSFAKRLCFASRVSSFHHPRSWFNSIMDACVLTEDSTATLGLAGGHRGNGGGILPAEALGLGANTGDVSAAGDVPHGDVLLHAAGQAGVLLGRERGTGGRDASLEAVLVHFLQVLLACCGQEPGMVTYSDERTGVGHGSFGLELAHDSSLDLLRSLRSSGGGRAEERRHCMCG